MTNQNITLIHQYIINVDLSITIFITLTIIIANTIIIITTGELGYDRLNGTRKIGPSYAKSVVYI